MKKAVVYAILGTAMILAACNGKVANRCGDKSKLASEVSLYTWTDYIHPGIKIQFQEECGVKVRETNYESNEEMLAALQAGDVNYDVIVPSDYMVQIMIAEGMLMELDYNTIANIKNMEKENIKQYFDPEQKYSVPYFWGTTGFAVDTTVVTYEPSWKMLFDPNSPYCGKISMLDDERETIGAALMYLGYSINETDPAHLEKAKNVLLEQAKCVKTYESNHMSGLMIRGETVLGHMWTSDAILTGTVDYGGRTGIKYVIPEEGATIWQDNLAIPVNAPHAYTAMVFVNYLNYPDVAALNAEGIGFGTPNFAAKRVMNPDLLADESIYPPPKVMARLQWIQDVGDALALYDRVWEEVKAVVGNR
jgi:spermidine/putrescine transport system substrate-binding protein